MRRLVDWLETRLMRLPPTGFWSLRVNDEYRSPAEHVRVLGDWQVDGPWEYDQLS